MNLGAIADRGENSHSAGLVDRGLRLSELSLQCAQAT